LEVKGGKRVEGEECQEVDEVIETFLQRRCGGTEAHGGNEDKEVSETLL
jgi:hypothetical protein